MKTPSILFLGLAMVVLPDGGHAACRHTHLADVVSSVHIHARNAVVGLIQFGQEKGICFGIEMADLNLLSMPVSFDAESETVGRVVRNVLPQERADDVSVSDDGVVLVRATGPRRPHSQLDVVVSEYQTGGITVPEAGLGLHNSLVRILDPSVQGFAGSIVILFPNDKVRRIDETGKTVADLLSRIVSHSPGGAWVAGFCAEAEILKSGRSCWTLLEYHREPELLVTDVSYAVQEEKRRFEEAAKIAAAKPSRAACRPTRLGHVVGPIHIHARNSVAGLIQFGQEKGICFGIEIAGQDLLLMPVSFDTGSETVGRVVRNVLPPKGAYDVSVSGDGVVLVRAAGPRSAHRQLDMVVPEFKIGGITVPEAGVELQFTLQKTLDPTIGGAAANVFAFFPDDKVQPIDETGKTVAELLTRIVSHSPGGAWVAGFCDEAEILKSGRSCWTLLEYHREPEALAADVSYAVQEERRRIEAATKPAAEKQ